MWSRRRWTTKKGDVWLSGPWVKRGTSVVSLDGQGARFELSKSVKNCALRMLRGRPIYLANDGILRDAVSDKELFPIDSWYCECEAGLFYRTGDEMRFADGFGNHLKIRDDMDFFAFPKVVRVSESEYEIRVGGKQYYLLDTMKWTCISI